MDRFQNPDFEKRLASISTMWTMLRDAHGDQATNALEARQLLLERYGGAIHRYLLAAVRDPHVADDLTQEFALRLVKGDYRNVNPGRGRFRDYVKTILFRMVGEYRRRQARNPAAANREVVEIPDSAEETTQLDQQWLDSWRDELLARSWNSLFHQNRMFYEVLRFRAENPQLPGDKAAGELSRKLDKPVTPAAMRQTLKRARDAFAGFLIEEVAGSLDDPDRESVESELIDLNLHVYCNR